MNLNITSLAFSDGTKHEMVLAVTQSLIIFLLIKQNIEHNMFT